MGEKKHLVLMAHVQHDGASPHQVLENKGLEEDRGGFVDKHLKLEMGFFPSKFLIASQLKLAAVPVGTVKNSIGSLLTASVLYCCLIMTGFYCTSFHINYPLMLLLL